MILIFKRKATQEEINKISEGYSGGYINIVVDIERKILAAGGQRHSETQLFLMGSGSRQENLWGGGFDPKTKEINYDSMLNLRPRLNPARKIVDPNIRSKFEKIVRDLLVI